MLGSRGEREGGKHKALSSPWPLSREEEANFPGSVVTTITAHIDGAFIHAKHGPECFSRVVTLSYMRNHRTLDLHIWSGHHPAFSVPQPHNTHIHLYTTHTQDTQTHTRTTHTNMHTHTQHTQRLIHTLTHTIHTVVHAHPHTCTHT